MIFRDRAGSEPTAEGVGTGAGPSSQQGSPSPLPSPPALLGQGLGLPLPTQPTGRRKTGGVSRSTAGRDRSSSSSGPGGPAAGVNDRISATLDELNQRTQETVESMEADGPDEEMVERLVKQFEELGGNQVGWLVAMLTPIFGLTFFFSFFWHGITFRLWGIILIERTFKPEDQMGPLDSIFCGQVACNLPSLLSYLHPFSLCCLMRSRS